jgi:hypothetical protein
MVDDSLTSYPFSQGAEERRDPRQVKGPGFHRYGEVVIANTWVRIISDRGTNTARIVVSAEDLAGPAHQPVDAIAVTGIDPVGDYQLRLIAEWDAMP